MNFFLMLILLNTITYECTGCHPFASLVEKGEMGSQKSVMEKKGEGVKVLSSFEVKGTGFVLKWLGIEWVKRGKHSQMDMERCEMCHEEHGITLYPDEGGDCKGCHDWLREIPEGGELIISGGHKKVFHEGFVGPRPGIKVRAINPGCRGCHNLMEGKHGAITQCTDCHNFSILGIHDSHTELIEETAKFNDVKPQEACGFCHFQGDERYRAGCYNCHLSGHNPTLYYWKTQ